MNVLVRETLALRRVRTQDAEGAFVSVEGDAQAADDAVFAEQRSVRESIIRGKVFHEDGRLRAQNVGGWDGAFGRRCRLAH